jgi:hypothetical protein
MHDKSVRLKSQFANLAWAQRAALQIGHVYRASLIIALVSCIHRRTCLVRAHSKTSVPVDLHDYLAKKSVIVSTRNNWKRVTYKRIFDLYSSKEKTRLR